MFRAGSSLDRAKRCLRWGYVYCTAGVHHVPSLAAPPDRMACACPSLQALMASLDKPSDGECMRSLLFLPKLSIPGALNEANRTFAYRCIAKMIMGTSLTFNHVLGGVVGQKASNATAFPHRNFPLGPMCYTGGLAPGFGLDEGGKITEKFTISIPGTQ